MDQSRTNPDDGLDIPEFLIIPQAERNAAWLRNPPKAMPSGFGGRVMTETEKLYRASIERDKAAQRARDEPRFEAMRAKVAEDKAAKEEVAAAVRAVVDQQDEQKSRKPARKRMGHKRKSV